MEPLLLSGVKLSKAVTIGGKAVTGGTWISCFCSGCSSSSPQETSGCPLFRTCRAVSCLCTGPQTLYICYRQMRSTVTLPSWLCTCSLRTSRVLNLEASEKKFTTRIDQGNWDYVHPTLRVKGYPIFRDPSVLTTYRFLFSIPQAQWSPNIFVCLPYSQNFFEHPPPVYTYLFICNYNHIQHMSKIMYIINRKSHYNGRNRSTQKIEVVNGEENEYN